MNDKVREMIVLSLYGELGEAEEYLLGEHLKRDLAARREMEGLKRLHALLEEDGFKEPPEGLLYQARHELSQALDAETAAQPSPAPSRPAPQARPGWAWRFSRALGLGGALPAMAGALAMLLAGLGLGYALFKAPAATTPLTLDEEPPSIAEVRFVESGSSQLEMVFYEVTQRRIQGAPDDARVRRLLAHAAVNEENDGVRLRAVDQFLENDELLKDDLIKRTLIISLQSDSNAGVRQRALEALEKLPFDREIEQAYLNVLRYDPNPGMRVAVINALESASLQRQLRFSEDMLQVLRERQSSDENDYVRIRSEAFLERVDQ